MASTNVNITWPSTTRNGKQQVASLNTGGFVQTTFAATRMAPEHLRHSRCLDLVHEPWFAGYCLDAPEFMPAGSQMNRHGSSDARAFARG